MIDKSECSVTVSFNRVEVNNRSRGHNHTYVGLIYLAHLGFLNPITQTYCTVGIFYFLF